MCYVRERRRGARMIVTLAPNVQERATAGYWHASSFLGRRRKGRNQEPNDDDASANRSPLSHLRHSFPLASGGFDQFIWREAHGLPRARRGHTTAAVPDPYVQP